MQPNHTEEAIQRQRRKVQSQKSQKQNIRKQNKIEIMQVNQSEFVPHGDHIHQDAGFQSAQQEELQSIKSSDSQVSQESQQQQQLQQGKNRQKSQAAQNEQHWSTNLKQQFNQGCEKKPISPSSQQYELPPLQQIQLKSKNFNNTFKTTLNSIKQMKTNIAYNLKHSSLGIISDILSNRKKLTLKQNTTSKSKALYLLGNRYKVCQHQEREAFLMKFTNVIWLSYRSNIYGVDTDAGWGCMIRVCQMVLAETFQRFYKSSQKIRSMTVSKLASKQKSLKQIIEYFMDSPQAYFSLTRICQRGNIKQRWTSSIQIFTIMKDILRQINFELNIQVFSGGIQIGSTSELDKQDYPILIAVSNRVGVKGIPLHFESHLLKLMKMNNQYFVGCVGGISGQALYIIGHYQGRAIFLDPHYVQSTQSQQYNTSSYFQSQPYSIAISSLSPSIALCYYVRNKQEYIDLLKILYELQLSCYPNVCLQVCLCQQLKKEVIQQKRQKQLNFKQTQRKNSMLSMSDDEFQIL